MKEVYDFLKEAGTYYLSTIEDNKPRVRPFGTINIYEDKLYIQTGLRKDVASQMIINPNIEICAVVGGDWLRVSARAVIDESADASENMLDKYPELKQMYQPGDGNCVVFYLEDVEARFYSFTKPFRKIKF